MGENSIPESREKEYLDKLRKIVSFKRADTKTYVLFTDKFIFSVVHITGIS